MKNKVLYFKVILLLLFIIQGNFWSQPLLAWESINPRLAPLNPEFLEYHIVLENLRMQLYTVSGHSLGYIPSPLDLSHLTGSFPFKKYALAPASYDLRTLGKITPVKDQGSCGSCWSFATYGSLESILLPSETWDFSENNLKNTHGFDPGHCDGGNGFISTAYLARWSGPIKETDDPYKSFSNVSPSNLSPQKHIQNVIILPDRAGPSDNESIKQAIMTNGALYTSMYWSDSYYNGTYKTYYFSGTYNSNHAVTIVGWDDNFDKNKFSTVPPGNGAFIIKNSWGTNWGENGYFHISYYDSNIGKENFSYSGPETTANYSTIYQYDPLGWISSIGYGNTTGWFANIFTSASTEQLSAVSFYSASPNSTYEIYIYRDVTSAPTSGSLAGSKNGTLASSGYNTIPLTAPVPLTANQKFSVVVNLSTPGYNYPIPMEYPLPGYSSQATAAAGQSYVSSNGTSWTDIATYYANANICLKAFSASSGDTIPPKGLIQINGGVPATKSPSVSLSLTASDESPPIQMCISNTTACSSWTAFAATKSWTLTSGNGTKIVYVWFRDTWGNTTPTPYSASIILDTIAPTNGTVTATPGAGQITLNWNGFSDTGSGIGGYKVVYAVGSAPIFCSTGTPIPGYNGVSTSYIHTGLINATYGYRVCAIDTAGNTSTGTTASAKPLPPETTPPTGLIHINGGVPATKSPSVSLSLTASDESPPIQMCISNTTACSSWTAFAATKSWTLTSGNGTKIVYVWFRDTWGNTTPTPYSASIILDTIAPTNGTVTATPGAGQITLNWNGFSDTGSGIASYKIVFSTWFAPTFCSAGTLINTFDSTASSYVHSGLTKGMTYYYGVCALDNAGNMSTGAMANAKPQ